jgi:hypothetical protein
MSTLKVNAIEKKDADQTLTVKDAAMTGVTTIAGSPTVADMSNFTFPAGMPIKVSHSLMSSDYGPDSTTTEINFWTPTYTPIKNNSIIYASLYLELEHQTAAGNGDNRLAFVYEITGSGVTNFDRAVTHWTFGRWGALGTTRHLLTTVQLKPMTVTTTDAISYVLRMKNENSHSDSKWTIRGNNSDETMIIFTEVAG